MCRVRKPSIGEDRVVVVANHSPPCTCQGLELMEKSFPNAIVGYHREMDIKGYLKQSLHKVGRCKLKDSNVLRQLLNKRGRTWLSAKSLAFLAQTQQCKVGGGSW